MNSDSMKILIVDDDPLACKLIETIVRSDDYVSSVAENVEQALKFLALKPEDYFLVITDYYMPGKTGIDLLKTVKKLYPVIEVIIITGEGSEDVAIQALRLGAMDYIQKPISKDELLVLVHKAKELYKLRRQNQVYFQEITKVKDYADIEMESLKIFIKGMEEEVVDLYDKLRKSYAFIKKLDSSVLSQELNKELQEVLESFDEGIERF
ncbi:MAG: response regulator [Candidatus Eremiobacterota bacterium]